MISREPLTSKATSGRFRVGEWLIDPALDEISRGSEIVKLEPRMMRLLCRLSEARGQVVSSQQLLDSVWAGVVVGPASVYQAISALRKILGDTEATPTYIATVLRKGYRLRATVAPIESDGAIKLAKTLPASAVPVRSSRASRLALATAVAFTAIFAAILVVKHEKQPAPTVSAPAAVWPAPDLPSLAVLAFQAGAPNDSSALLAACISGLLQDRLSTQKGLLAVSVYSTKTFSDPRLDVRDVGKRLHVRYVLRGDASRVADQLKVNVTLLDTSSGAEIWSKSFERTAQEVTALREEIVARIGAALKVTIGSVGNLPVDLPAYELYMRGLQTFLKLNEEGYTAAKDIFARTTVLYPEFARAYFGLAASLNVLKYYADPARSLAAKKHQEDLVVRALDRAIELDPEFGEAMFDRAEHFEDPLKAEEMFRRALDLSPSYDVGAFKYGIFLENRGRVGESIAAINHGLRINPLSSLLMRTKAGFLLGRRGDVEGYEAVLRDLLETHPEETSTLTQLGASKYIWHGEVAEGIRLIERQIVLDPKWQYSRYMVASAYLDVDDPAAALSVAKDLPLTRLDVAQYRHDAHAIAMTPGDWLGFCCWSATSVDPVADAMRDEAIASGNYAAALAAFEKYRVDNPEAQMVNRGVELAYAHTLLLSGDTQRGHELAKSLLQKFDTEEVGRPKYWFSRDRASVYALLGDDERALSKLAESVKHKNLFRWWYTAELDPVFARLRKDPRFQALAAEAKRHRAEQRALLEEMRRKGEVPKRP